MLQKKKKGWTLCIKLRVLQECKLFASVVNSVLDLLKQINVNYLSMCKPVFFIIFECQNGLKTLVLSHM